MFVFAGWCFLVFLWQFLHIPFFIVFCLFLCFCSGGGSGNTHLLPSFTNIVAQMSFFLLTLLGVTVGSEVEGVSTFVVVAHTFFLSCLGTYTYQPMLNTNVSDILQVVCPIYSSNVSFYR